MDGECSDGAMSSSPTVSGSGASAGCPGSPLSPLPSTSPTGKRRSAKKRVVTVPLADVSGPRPKGVGEGNTPTDSWAWRKYGQKPIKGSPYPRAYYRCSSSKGCPARKQVERNRADPAMVIVTYSSEHNHSGLVARAQSRQNQKSKAQPSPPEMAEPEDKPAAWAAPPAACAAPPAEDPAIEVHDDFRWLYDVVSVTSTSPSDETDEMMYGPMFLGTVDTALLLPDELGDVGGEGSEEDALFEGLGELPECAMVFQRRAGGGLAGEVKVGQPPEGTAMT